MHVYERLVYLILCCVVTVDTLSLYVCMYVSWLVLQWIFLSKYVYYCDPYYLVYSSTSTSSLNHRIHSL